MEDPGDGSDHFSGSQTIPQLFYNPNANDQQPCSSAQAAAYTPPDPPAVPISMLDQIYNQQLDGHFNELVTQVQLQETDVRLKEQLMQQQRLLNLQQEQLDAQTEALNARHATRDRHLAYRILPLVHRALCITSLQDPAQASPTFAPPFTLLQDHLEQQSNLLRRRAAQVGPFGELLARRSSLWQAAVQEQQKVIDHAAGYVPRDDDDSLPHLHNSGMQQLQQLQPLPPIPPALSQSIQQLIPPQPLVSTAAHLIPGGGLLQSGPAVQQPQPQPLVSAAHLIPGGGLMQSCPPPPPPPAVQQQPLQPQPDISATMAQYLADPTLLRNAIAMMQQQQQQQNQPQPRSIILMMPQQPAQALGAPPAYDDSQRAEGQAEVKDEPISPTDVDDDVVLEPSTLQLTPTTSTRKRFLNYREQKDDDDVEAKEARLSSMFDGPSTSGLQQQQQPQYDQVAAPAAPAAPAHPPLSLALRDVVEVYSEPVSPGTEPDSEEEEL